MAILNSHQLLMLDHYSNGEFAYLGNISDDNREGYQEDLKNCGDLLVPFLLEELDDIDDLSTGINRIRTNGNALLDLADTMETIDDTSIEETDPD